MSDENDKVRRNLVMTSAAIAIAWLLDISLLKILEKYMEVTSIAATEWKLWGLGFAIMLYLLLRYNFSPEGEAYRVTLKGEHKKQLLFKIFWLVQHEANRYTRTGKQSAILGDGLKEAEKYLSRQPEFRTLIDKGIRPYLKASIYEQGPTPWSHRFSLTAVFPSGHGGGGAGPAVTAAIEARWLRHLLKTWAWLHAYFYSEASTTNAMPVFIAFVAMVALWVKVFFGYTA